MLINFDKLKTNNQIKQLQPRDIFMSLPVRTPDFEYPRDVQSQVWESWFQHREESDLIIKMNTGSGKTIVGLLLLQSCLEENKGPAIYVVPDNYLIDQVTEDANKLGIKVTCDIENYTFMQNQAILIINIHKLVNGMSCFGMRSRNNIKIGSIVIDDVHACIDTINQQCSMTIEKDNKNNTDSKSCLYDEIIRVLCPALQQYRKDEFQKIIELQDPLKTLLVPFWVWQDKIDDIKSILNANYNEDQIKFNFPLICDCLEICNCVISSRMIEITSKFPPLHKIKEFFDAQRRIFMSATLADDTVFVSTMGMNSDSFPNIITPKAANDIGDRLILFPQLINNRISDDQMKDAIIEIAKEKNVVIIVPSKKRAEYWDKVADLTLDASNLKSGVAKLKTKHIGLTVLINKYDGVDLPDDACRLLVIDGIPNFNSEYENNLNSYDPGNKSLLKKQVQKIEQGMGRGIRSTNDYCVTLLMNQDLKRVLIREGGKQYFSKATLEQFELSQQIWDQLSNREDSTLSEIMELADYSFSRNIDWLETSKSVLSGIEYDKVPHINEVTVMEKKAFQKAENKQYREAFDIIATERNKTNDINVQGHLTQLMAEYCNFYDSTRAQILLAQAHEMNNSIQRAIDGIKPEQNKKNDYSMQIKNIKKQIQDSSLNNYTIELNKILEDFCFFPNDQKKSKKFEEALYQLGLKLGFGSERPEKDGSGPDNLWKLNETSYLVIECKSGSSSDFINKSDCSQLLNSQSWFKRNYRNEDIHCIPLLIHPQKRFDFDCAPDPSFRVMTPDLLSLLKKEIIKFAQELNAQDIEVTAETINSLLKKHSLNEEHVVSKFTKPYKIKNRG